MILPPFFTQIFTFTGTTFTLQASISAQGNSRALEDPLIFYITIEINVDTFAQLNGIIFDISHALVTIEDLDGKGTNVHYLYIHEILLDCYVVLEVGIPEEPVSTEGDPSSVIVRRNLIEPNIPVFVNVTTRLVSLLNVLPGASPASADGKSSS